MNGNFNMNAEIMNGMKRGPNLRDLVKQRFLHSFKEDEFVQVSPESNCWVLPGCAGNHLIQVIPNFETATMQIDADLGVKASTPEELLELRAYMNYFSSFQIKCGGFATARDGETVTDVSSWEIGEPVHFYLVTAIVPWGSELIDIVEGCIGVARDARSGCQKILNGTNAYELARKTRRDDRTERIRHLLCS